MTARSRVQCRSTNRRLATCRTRGAIRREIVDRSKPEVAVAAFGEWQPHLVAAGIGKDDVRLDLVAPDVQRDEVLVRDRAARGHVDHANVEAIVLEDFREPLLLACDRACPH
jgi:hypothetical protein